MIARQLQQLLGQPVDRIEILPWWVGPSTLERVLKARRAIRGSVSSLSLEEPAVRQALARIGFAAADSTASS